MLGGDRRFSGRAHPYRLEAIASTLVAAVAACFVYGAHAFEPRPVPGRLILKLQPSVRVADAVLRDGSSIQTGIATLDALHQRFEVARFAHLFPGEATREQLGKAGVIDELTQFYSVDFPPELDLESVRDAYAALDVVELAEYDWMAPLHLQTNDSSGQWHIQTTTGRDAHVTGGWNHSTGDPDIVLAIADSGVDWKHPDLGGSGPDFVDGNIWINDAELNGLPGVDDDRNGFVDDARGWDFVSVFSQSAPAPGEDASLADNNPMDFNGHGTHVAGIASAITNNGLGVSGVGFSCKVMALRIGGSVLDRNGDEVGVVFMSYAAQAINYARINGAHAFNASWGSVRTTALDAAVDAATGAADMVIVVSAGNDGSSSGAYLSTRPENDTFTVASTTQNDARAPFSNYGTWVDVAAPGVGIFSTYFDHNAVDADQHTYKSLQGTSMSAPLVTGLVGLVRARWPFFSRALVEQVIENGCDNIDALNPGFEGQLGAGRVNALKTFNDFFLSVPEDYPNIELALAASAPGDTIALRGGVTYRTDMLLVYQGRLIQGGWDDVYRSRDASNPAVISGSGTTAVLEVVPGIERSAVLDALRFTGGAAKTVTDPNGRFGGGVLCRDASPTFRDCVFEANSAGNDLELGGGGGAFFKNSAALLERCTFVANEARLGGALYALDSNLQLNECVIESNTVHSTGDSRGAGIYVNGGEFTMRGGSIRNCEQAASGGGVHATGASRVSLEGVHITGNSAWRGGALALEAESQLTLTSSVVNANVAAQLGGGIYSLGGRAAIANASFDANLGAGGAIFVQEASAEWSLRNSTVTNHATTAAILLFNSDADLDYNLFWNNREGDVSGATTGPNALFAAPLFVDAASGDLALGAHSPALDSGDPGLAHTDADGTRNDRGAFGGPAGRSRAPSVPVGLEVRRVDDVNGISWTASPEVDVDYYAIYRSADDSTFAPTPGNFIVSVPAHASSYFDPATASSWYRVAAVDLSGASSGFTPGAQALPTTGVEDPDGGVTPDAAPLRYALHANVPNPFNPRTRIRFEIPEAGRVEVQVLDARGRLIRRVLQTRLPAGPAEVVWDGRDDRGRGVPSGTYVYRVVAGRWTGTRKMTLLR